MPDANPNPIVVPEIAPASNQPSITEVTIPVPPAVEKLAVPGIQGPKEALGEDSTAEMERMQDEMTGQSGKLKDRPRDEKGRLIKADGSKDEKQPEKPVAKPVKAKEKAPVPAKTDVKKPDAVKPAAIEQKTEKPTEPEKPVEVKTTEPVKPVEPDKDALAKKDADWIEAEAAKYGLDQKKWDEMIASGEGFKDFAKILATSALNTRKAMAEQFNSILEEIRTGIKPVLEQQNMVQQFQTESHFLESNPDIQSNPKGLETYRKVAADLHQGYSEIQQKVSQGTATPQEKAWSILYESQTPEQFAESVAFHTRAALQQAPAPTEAAKPVIPAPAPKPAPKPFNGDRPGSGARTVTESTDARALREMNERQGINGAI